MQIVGEPTIPIPTNGKIERVYSVGATVSASGEKLPLLFIKKGIDESAASVKALEKILTHHHSELVLSLKGWITEKLFIYYLEHIFKPNVITPCVDYRCLSRASYP
jgi:hypothetical protein